MPIQEEDIKTAFEKLINPVVKNVTGFEWKRTFCEQTEIRRSPQQMASLVQTGPHPAPIAIRKKALASSGRAPPPPGLNTPEPNMSGQFQAGPPPPPA